MAPIAGIPPLRCQEANIFVVRLTHTFSKEIKKCEAVFRKRVNGEAEMTEMVADAG